MTYTNGSLTPVTALPNVGSAISSGASAYLRTAPDVIVSHPRFLSWLATVGENIHPPYEWTAFVGGRPISSGAMASNRGAGTNESRPHRVPA